MYDEMTAKERQSLIAPCESLSISRQCELLGVNRSTLYYKARPTRPMELLIKQVIDYIYTRRPFLGHRKITMELCETYGLKADRKTVMSYMNDMGVHAIYPKRNLSKPDKQNKVYPPGFDT